MPTRHIAMVLVAASVLAGCSYNRAPQPQYSEEEIWLRSDGQSGRNNPALAAQFAADKAACTVQGGINRACMTRRAYILVPKSQVEATAARLRAASGVN